MNIKKLIAVLFGVLLSFSVLQAQDACATDGQKRIVITITSSSNVTSGFGLAVANAMQGAGVKSTVFIAGGAVPFALKKGDTHTFAGAKLQDLISKLIKQGGKVMICEGFVKMGGIKKSDMVNGVEVSSPADLAGALYAPNVKTMTF